MSDPSLWFAAYFVVGMFVGGLNSKALAATIVFAIALLALYPDVDKATVVTLLYLPAVLLSQFRD